MKVNYLVGILVFLAIVNIVAVDTYVYYQLVRAPEGSSNILARDATLPGRRGGIDTVSTLDEKQRREIGRITNAFRKATGDIYGRIKVLDDEIYELIRQDPVPQEKIDQRLKEISELRLKKSGIAIRMMIETRSILSAEQQEKLFGTLFRTQPRVPGDRPDQSRTERRLRRLSEELDLTPEQVKQIGAILEVSGKKLSELEGLAAHDSSRYGEERKSIMDEEDAGVMIILSDAQKTKYIQMKKEKGGPGQKPRPRDQ